MVFWNILANSLMRAYLHQEVYGGVTDVWVEEPTTSGLVVYSFVIPFISLFAICGNSITLYVLLRKEFKSSIYTYLTVLATTDLINSALLFISGLSKGVLWYSSGWSEYEAIVAVPINGGVSTLAVVATVSVAMDRVIYLACPTRRLKPIICTRNTARKIMALGILLAILFNLPYCFIFEFDADGRLVSSEFFDSRYITFHNWLKFTLFGIIPSIVLIFGNGFLICYLQKAHRMQKMCRRRMKMDSYKRGAEQKYVTLTLVAIVFFFLIGEIPAQLASRTTAVTILFHGDQERADKSKSLETFRQLATLLNAINIAANFVLYCLFSPMFRRSLNSALSCTASRKSKTIKAKNVQVNVFVLNTGAPVYDGGNLDLPLLTPNDRILNLFNLRTRYDNMITMKSSNSETS